MLATLASLALLADPPCPVVDQEAIAAWALQNANARDVAETLGALSEGALCGTSFFVEGPTIWAVGPPENLLIVENIVVKLDGVRPKAEVRIAAETKDGGAETLDALRLLDNESRTPLHVAKSAEIASLLLRAGAALSVVDSRHHDTPAHAGGVSGGAAEDRGVSKGGVRKGRGRPEGSVVISGAVSESVLAAATSQLPGSKSPSMPST